MLGVEDVVSVCSGLINVEEESGIVRLVHYTAQHFLETILETWNTKAQVDIATTCLAVLSLDDPPPARVDWQRKRWIPRYNDFFAYAAQHCGDHARSVQAQVYEMACTCVLDDEFLLRAAQGLSKGWSTTTRLHMFSWVFEPQKEDLADSTSTALHVLAHYGLHEIMRVLLTRPNKSLHRKINMMDRWSRTPLLLAVASGYTETTKLLIEHGAIVAMQESQEGQGDRSPIHVASRRGHVTIVELLLDMGVDVDSKSKSGKTALLVASRNAQHHVVEILLKRGANVDLSEPLYIATRKGDVEVVSLLLHAGANVNIESGGMCPLMLAARHSHAQTVTKLLHAGAEIDSYSRHGTALAMASGRGDGHIVRLLLDAGADCNAGPNSKTPLERAIQGGHDRIVELLRARGATTRDRLVEAVSQESQD